MPVLVYGYIRNIVLGSWFYGDRRGVCGRGVESMEVMPSKEHIYGLFKGMHCFKMGKPLIEKKSVLCFLGACN